MSIGINAISGERSFYGSTYRQRGVRLMPDRPPHRCNYPGCSILIYDDAAQCDEHRNKIAKVKQHGRGGARTYSPAWKDLVAHAKACGNVVCQSVDSMGVRCRRPVWGFHHVIAVDRCHDLELDQRNIVGLCQACHNRVTFSDSEPRELYVPTVWIMMGIQMQEDIELLPGMTATQAQRAKLWSLANRSKELIPLPGMGI